MELDLVHPLIDGLVMELPEPGKPFPMARRQDWIECATLIFALLYIDPTESTAALKEVPHEAGDGFGESLNEGAHPVRDTEAGTQAPSVDTNTPETAPDVAADRARKPSPVGAEPVRQVGGDTDKSSLDYSDPIPPETVAQTVPSGEAQSSQAGGDAVVSPAQDQAAFAEIGETIAEALAAPVRKGPVRNPESLLGRIRAHMAAHPGHSARQCADALGVTYRQVHDSARKVVTFANEPQPEPPVDFAPAPAPGASLVSRIRTLNAEHPEYTCNDAAKALGEHVLRIRSNSNVHKIKWARESTEKPAPLKDMIAPLYLAHPDWGVGQFSKAMPEFKYTSISTELARLRRADRDTPVEAASPEDAPEPADEPERLPAAAPSPPSAPTSAVVAAPMRRAPKGTRFWLRDDAGLYLHYGCEAMTSDRRYAWSGSQDQLLACRRKYKLAGDLVERIVEKEPSRAVA